MARTNILLDDGLVKEALKLTKLKTKREVVNHALQELVQKARRKRMLELEGKVRWTGDLDEIRESRI